MNRKNHQPIRLRNNRIDSPIGLIGVPPKPVYSCRPPVVKDKGGADGDG